MNVPFRKATDYGYYTWAFPRASSQQGATIELIQKIRFLMNNAFSIDPRKGQGFKKISAENEIIKVKKKIPR